MRKALHTYLPVPQLLSAKSVLFVQPHPDDMEIGAGATIARLTQNNVPVTCLTVTDGAVGTSDRSITPEELKMTRRKETENGAHVLGVKELIWLDYPDAGLLPLEEVRGKITRAIRQVRPEAVMVCDPWLPYEAHPDHRNAGLATTEAAFLSNMPHFYPADLKEGLLPHGVKMIAFYYTAWPNTFISTAGHWETKFEALSCHKSQFTPPKLEEIKRLLSLKAAHPYPGKENTQNPTENIKVLSMAHLHIFEEAWRC